MKNNSSGLLYYLAGAFFLLMGFITRSMGSSLYILYVIIGFAAICLGSSLIIKAKKEEAENKEANTEENASEKAKE